MTNAEGPPKPSDKEAFVASLSVDAIYTGQQEEGAADIAEVDAAGDGRRPSPADATTCFSHRA